MKLFIVLFALCVQGLLSSPVIEDETKEKHPDVGLNVLELIEKYGYPVEDHRNVQTEDGYLLDIHRIPHGRNNSDLVNRPVVLVMHGVLSSSVDWVNMGPGKGLGYILADRGYDVWMGNCRGNTWSRKHIKWNPDRDSEFWDFSWNEIGRYDLPAFIDYIIKETGQDQIYYIGHSQGTTAGYVMMAERPEYNDKVRLMSSLAPVAYMNHIPNIFFKLLATMESVIHWVTKFLGMNEFVPHSELYTLIGQLMCNDQAITQAMCSNIIFLIAGYDSDQLNASMIPVIMSNTPAGVATKQLIHYSQEINSGKFRKFDYGMLNMIKYGSLVPPKYDLSKITVPIALYYSENDLLAAVKDVDRLYTDLPSAFYKYKMPNKKFNHLDFLWAVDAKEDLYDRVINMMDRY